MKKNTEFINGGFFNYGPQKGKYRKPQLALNFVRGILAIKVRKPEIIWRTEIPTEPVLYVCNHTKLYAPASVEIYYRNVRLWSNANFLTFKDCWRQMMDKVLKNRKILTPIAILVMPLIVAAFRQMAHVPVYRDLRIRDTFRECSEGLASGRSSMVFPELYDGGMANKYLNKLQSGYLYAADKYYRDTGKILKLYPVYCAETLKKLVIGDPIEYNPNESVKAQSERINTYLEDKIGELGDSLPEHKISAYK